MNKNVVVLTALAVLLFLAATVGAKPIVPECSDVLGTILCP